MADNYLEKQMELYQARKAAWERGKKLGKQKRPTTKPAQPKENGVATKTMEE